MDNFAKCITYILREEGGNDDDPNDHGGRTSRGITQREYNAFRSRKGMRAADVWHATDAEIREIYLTQYWQPWCDKLPAGLDLVYFDFAVNAGGVQATRSLQRALGGVAVDGRMGLVTLNAVESHSNIPALIRAFSDQRRAFYRALKQFSRYGRGWLGRAARIEQAALSLANAQPAEHVPENNIGAGTAKAKGDHPADSAVTPEQGVAITTGAATGTAGLESVIHQAQDQISPLTTVLHSMEYVFAALVFIGLGITLYGFWKRSKNQKVI